MTDVVTIDRRFNGPPDSAHGGYVCGLVGKLLGGAAEVTLKRPPPLDAPLLVRRRDQGTIDLMSGDDTVASGVCARVEIGIPDDPPSLEETIAAARNYPGFDWHPYPACFACGTVRAEGDGLRIFSGLVAGRKLLAAPWVPYPELTGVDGLVKTEFIWAALDCPSGWATTLLDPGEGEAHLLGRFAADVMGTAKAAQSYIALGWADHVQGRKVITGSAILTPAGIPIAVGRAVWIKPK